MAPGAFADLSTGQAFLDQSAQQPHLCLGQPQIAHQVRADVGLNLAVPEHGHSAHRKIRDPLGAAYEPLLLPL